MGCPLFGRERPQPRPPAAPDCSADEAAAILQRWAADGPPPLAGADSVAVQAYRELRVQRDALVVHALDELQSRLGYLQRADERQRERTREDLHYLAGFVEAAVLTGDATVLAAYFPWLRDVLTSRGVAEQVLAPTVSAVTSGLSAVGQEAAAQLLRAAASPVVDGLAL